MGLRFLSGRLEGGVVPLHAGRPVVLGREPGADLLISEELVSRRHARVTFDGRRVIIEDLGSTNGTFLNGSRVERAEIGEGDRVLVGETIFTVVVRQQPSSASATQLRSILDPDAAERQPASAIQGRLDEVPLFDIVQLVATARKSGVLSLLSRGRAAQVRLDRGSVVGCTLQGRSDLPSGKILFRLFEWTTGQFELKPHDASPAAETPFMDSTDALLMEAARHMDEMRRLRATLPAHFTVSGEIPEVALDPEDRALVSLASRLGELDAVLDATPLPDLVAAERLASLHARGVIVGAG